MKTPHPLEAHVFVCQNLRPDGHPRGSCGRCGSEGLLKELKLQLAKVGKAQKIRAQKAGCLDTCEYGPSLVIYPQGIWYGPLEKTDIPRIVESLLEGKILKSLVIPGKHG